MEKEYEVHCVGRGGFPLGHMDSFMASTDKEAKEHSNRECYFNRSVNTGHNGIRIFRMPERKCILTELWGA